MKENAQEVVELCVQTGELLLKSGAEIFHVQDTLERIADSYGIEQFHVYVIANGLFVSVNDGEKLYTTQLRYVPLAPVHLGRICAVNELSRMICDQQLPLKDAYLKIEEAKQIPFSSPHMQILASGVGAATFCYLLGGSVMDSAASFISGLALYIFFLYILKGKTSKIMQNILGSSVVGLIGCLSYHFGLGNSLDHIIMGSIIPLVPGVLITTSVRDIINSDYLSGMIHLLDAVLVAGCIACGVGISLSIYQMLGVVL
ncbi:threonine/serine ThrE exporter family protein [Beduini massiliensis]|uniref:threonine/serine ThrE exporter family protein n=1 Tax=Beduini massiliensis TaxID=1585974 RepID=UPI003569FBBD